MDVIFPETVLAFDPESNGDVIGVHLSELRLFYFEPGETYSIVFDGVTYLCETIDLEESTCVGDLGLDEGTIQNAEYPFLIVSLKNPSDGDISNVIVTTLEGAEHTVAIYRGAVEPEEPTAPIGFIEYLVNPKYHMGKPFRGFIGWKMAQGGGGDSPQIVATLENGCLHIKNAPAVINGNILEVG